VENRKDFQNGTFSFGKSQTKKNKSTTTRFDRLKIDICRSNGEAENRIE
jgi:hypothetical protein